MCPLYHTLPTQLQHFPACMSSPVSVVRAEHGHCQLQCQISPGFQTSETTPRLHQAVGAAICFLWLQGVILPSVVPSLLVIPASREERYLVMR